MNKRVSEQWRLTLYTYRIDTEYDRRETKRRLSSNVQQLKNVYKHRPFINCNLFRHFDRFILQTVVRIGGGGEMSCIELEHYMYYLCPSVYVHRRICHSPYRYHFTFLFFFKNPIKR